MAKINKKLKRSLGHRQKKKQGPASSGASASQGLLQQALALHRAGQLPQAEALYNQILRADPNHAEALHYLGMLALQVGKSDIAVQLISRAIASNPGYVDAQNDLGNAFQAQGRLEEAVSCYRKAVILKPGYVEAHYNLGNALRTQGQPEEAVACYRRAISLRPDYAEAHYNQGILLQALGKPHEAEAAFRQVLALKPDFAGAYNNLGIVLQSQDRPAEAEVIYRRAITLWPEFAEAHNNLGNALQDMGRSDEAASSYRQAVFLKPDYVEAHTNLGIVLQGQGKQEEAEASYRRAIAVQPDFADAHNNLGMTLQEQGKLDEAIACFRRVLELKPAYAEAHSNLLLCLNYLPDLSVSSYLDEARHYGRRVTAGVREPFSHWNCAVEPERLAVGVVSGDFRNHSVGYFLENLLTNIDPGKIDLIAYSTSRAADELTARIRPRFAAWKPLVGMDDETAARQIHDDGIHILLDLSGHTNHNRLPVFAWKPSPIQVSWLGYSSTTGLAQMDYLLADPFVAPQGEEGYFTETIWRLPESYLCFSPPKEMVEVGPLPALNEGRITFGSFNNPTKMNDSVVALWAKVLHAVPDSRLLLKSKRFSDPAFREATRTRFVACGIDPERILLESFVRNRAGHLAVYNRVDIALDPFPYNGTTTSVEGLWMGVPFLTRQGDRFLSHVGESIARNTGMTDWIAKDDEAYVAMADAHAADLDALAELRAGLRARALASPVFDGQRFARHFEEALWGMWDCFKRQR